MSRPFQSIDENDEGEAFNDGHASATHHSPALDTPYPISAAQIDCLHQNGWAPLPSLLSRQEAHKIRDLYLSSKQRTHLSDGRPVDSRNVIQHQSIVNGNSYLHGVVTSRRLSSAMVALMKQPQALYVQDISFFRPIGSQGEAYHQDFSYWPLDRKGDLSIWIALDDMDDEMGVLRYLEGSHREGPLGLIDKDDIRDVYPQLRDLNVGGGKALKAGDAQVHWGLTVHGSGPNEGHHRRDALALRYNRTDVVYTGRPHPHFDKLNLPYGKRIVDSGHFPVVGPDGLIRDWTQ